MSSGSYDFAYTKAEWMAERMLRYDKDPLRLAFARHLKKVAKAMHDIEWVDRDDYADGKEMKAIKAVLGDNWKDATVSEALSQMDEIRKCVEKALEANDG